MTLGPARIVVDEHGVLADTGDDRGEVAWRVAATFAHPTIGRSPPLLGCAATLSRSEWRPSNRRSDRDMIVLDHPHIPGEQVRLPTGELTAEVRKLFTAGQCHSFARALQLHTGWSAVWVGFRECHYDSGSRHTDIGDELLACDCQALHLGAASPWGTWVDITGERTFEQVAGTYGGEVIDRVTPEFWSVAERAGWPPLQLAAARVYLPLILAELDEQPATDRTLPFPG